MSEIEETTRFTPAFGADGLIAAIAADCDTGDVLMLAWMNEEAVRLTVETGEAHFWSRSRKTIWRKGEQSGETLKVIEIRADCDQDALLLLVEPQGRGAACHTGRRSCFYRTLSSDGRTLTISAEPLFDPEQIYGKSG
ncbi:MAG: phosphoribosyl-AMP cyclohydrolase [Parvibaculaceae bacterium]